MPDLIVKALYYVKRLFLERYAFLAALNGIVLLSTGFFYKLQVHPRYAGEFLLAGALAALLIVRLLVGKPERSSLFVEIVDQIEVGLLLLVNSFIVVHATGGNHSWLKPLTYLSVIYLLGCKHQGAGAFLLLSAMGLQLQLHHLEDPHYVDWFSRGVSLSYLFAFGVAGIVLLRLEIAARHRDYEKKLADDIRAMRQEAEDFRLISSPLSSRERVDRAIEESKLARGAVAAIHQGMFFVLDLLKRNLDLQTCVLLWLDETGQQLRIKELVTESHMVVETPIPAQAGVIGGIVKNRLLLNLHSARRGSRNIAYYGGPETVHAFVGVPILEEGHLRGVLCADRRVERTFSEQEEQILLQAAQQIVRSIQTERVFSAVERAKYEHERFYRASTMLNSALTLTQVYETAFAAAREITDFDFGAITLYDPQRRRHTICCVEGACRETYEGQVFGENAGLVSMVVKNKHFLPAGDAVRERDTVVFTKKLRLKEMESLIVLPLIVQDLAIGTFVLAAHKEDHFEKQTRDMLGVITNQVAVSIENAKMYKRMEEMATTDGLTRLPNHRTFQSRFSEMLHRADRHKKPVSIVLTDIDKFKSINDTYGHPVGDAVLRRVAAILAEQVRKVDLVARYGGEEFAMVLEETDGEGAQLLCERIRETVASQVMTSEKGAFRVTLSLGIATYPTDGTEKELLIERADQALYAGKQGGRNRTVRFAMMKAEKKLSA